MLDGRHADMVKSYNAIAAEGEVLVPPAEDKSSVVLLTGVADAVSRYLVPVQEKAGSVHKKLPSENSWFDYFFFFFFLPGNTEFFLGLYCSASFMIYAHGRFNVPA